MMGSFIYGDAEFSLELEDRLLLHLQIVIGAKLRRQESFYFVWFTGVEPDARRNSLWLHPSIPLRYHYAEPGTPSVSREWLERLTASANSTNGLIATPEPAIL